MGDEAALAREVKRALEGKDLSGGFMTACADLFFKALGGEYGFVPEGELARVMREVEEASAWLAGALTRSVGSLVERARTIGAAPVPEAVAAAWAVGKVLTGQYVRAAERAEAGGLACGGGVGRAGV